MLVLCSISKADLINYYQQISKVILPYLYNRPITIKRCPGGVDRECWIQKDFKGEKLPKFVKTYSTIAKSTQHRVDYILVNNLATLLWLVNLDTVEFHLWLSTIKKPNNPDWLVFDVDLTNGGKINDAVRVVEILKSRLLKLRLRNYLKTTGISGLHLVIPLATNNSYLMIRKFMKDLIYKIDLEFPELIATEARIKKRQGKIYLDPSQNSKGRTIICPYSLRATQTATVSTPLDWAELANLKIKKYNLKTLPGRLKSKGDIFKAILSQKQKLII